MKDREKGEIFRVGMVLLKAVEDIDNNCKNCYFYYLCKAINQSGYEARNEANDLLKQMTGGCNGVKFVRHHDKIKTIVKRKKQKQWKENLRLVTK